MKLNERLGRVVKARTRHADQKSRRIVIELNDAPQSIGDVRDIRTDIIDIRNIDVIAVTIFDLGYSIRIL